MRTVSCLFTLLLLLSFTLPAGAGAAETEQVPEELVSETAGVAQPISEVGRYRLFDGQLNVVTLKGPDLPERHLLKIDTVTGQTWIGKQVQYLDKKGKVVQQRYWELFEQYIEGQPAPPAAQGR